jgi:threonine aldolase
MRQAGVLAAAGIVAIQQERERLIEDHQNARLLAESIAHNRKIMVNMEGVQTNIVRLDVSPSGHDTKTFQQFLESKGLKAKTVSEKFIRMVTYREIGKEDILQAAHIFNESCQAI